MKKSAIIERLTDMLELTKAQDIKEQLTALIEELGPVSVAQEGKLTYYVQVNERKMDPAMKYPRQMVTCHDILMKNAKPGDVIERTEVMKWIGEASEELNTRQSPERIYAFYQDRMEKEGWITRSKERV